MSDQQQTTLRYLRDQLTRRRPQLLKELEEQERVVKAFTNIGNEMDSIGLPADDFIRVADAAKTAIAHVRENLKSIDTEPVEPVKPKAKK